MVFIKDIKRHIRVTAVGYLPQPNLHVFLCKIPLHREMSVPAPPVGISASSEEKEKNSSKSI